MYEKLIEHINTENLPVTVNNELRSLLKQIDQMVCRKRDDWQVQFDKLSEKLKNRDEELNDKNEKVIALSRALDEAGLKIESFDSGREAVVKKYEGQILDLKAQLRNVSNNGHGSPENLKATKSTTITRLNRELLKEKEKTHTITTKNDDLETKLKLTTQKNTALQKAHDELITRLRTSEKQQNAYQSQRRQANKMLSDLERSSQALVSRLESELMRDRRLLQNQESLNKNLQSKLDVSDQKNFAYEKEIKVLKQRNEMQLNSALAKSASVSGMNSIITSGMSTLAPSGLTTPLAGGQLTNSMPSMSRDLDFEKQQKLQIERSKLIRYAKELRKRVADRDSKILALSAELSEANSNLASLDHEHDLKVKNFEDNLERLETEVKSLTNTISRANSETMHYKRDLENIKMEISMASQMLFAPLTAAGQGPHGQGSQAGLPTEIPKLSSAGNITDLDELLLKIHNNFVWKNNINTSDQSINTDLNLTNSQLTQVTKKDEDEMSNQVMITPRMMSDMNETVSENGVTPRQNVHSRSNSNISQQSNIAPLREMPSFRPVSGPVPLINLKDNPSLTQDINEIFRNEELAKIGTNSSSMTPEPDSDLENHPTGVPVGPSGAALTPRSKLDVLGKNRKPLSQVNSPDKNKVAPVAPVAVDASLIFDPNGTLSMLDELNKKENEEINRLDNLLQSHIDNFLAETAEFF